MHVDTCFQRQKWTSCHDISVYQPVFLTELGTPHATKYSKNIQYQDKKISTYGVLKEEEEGGGGGLGGADEEEEEEGGGRGGKGGGGAEEEEEEEEEEM